MFGERLLASLLLTTLDICKLMMTYYVQALCVFAGLVIVMAADAYVQERGDYK